MAKTKTTTRAAELRRIAELSTRRIEATRDALDAYSEDIETLRSANDAFNGADLESVASQISDLASELSGLVDLGLLPPEKIAELEKIAEQLKAFSSNSEGVGPDTIGPFIEHYEELESALNAFEDLKEQDRYEGKGDDMESSWEEVMEAMEGLADAADELGLDKAGIESSEAV